MQDASLSESPQTIPKSVPLKLRLLSESDVDFALSMYCTTRIHDEAAGQLDMGLQLYLPRVAAPCMYAMLWILSVLDSFLWLDLVLLLRYIYM